MQYLACPTLRSARGSSSGNCRQVLRSDFHGFTGGEEEEIARIEEPSPAFHGAGFDGEDGEARATVGAWAGQRPFFHTEKFAFDDEFIDGRSHIGFGIVEID